MRAARLAIPLLLIPMITGCATRAGIAYLEIENDQSVGDGGKAEPVFVDPRLQVDKNEYRRSYINNGSNILQKIRIKGPIMIVPAPATQPTR
jgi:hypothetical protein